MRAALLFLVLSGEREPHLRGSALRLTVDVRYRLIVGADGENAG